MPAPKPSSQPWRRQTAISLPAASRIAIAILTARSAGSGQGTGSLKNTMIPSPAKMVERTLEFGDEGPQCAMVFALKIQHFLGLGRLGEGGVTAQIAEHDDDLATVAFKDLLIALRNDKLGQLRCQKPLQPADPA